MKRITLFLVGCLITLLAVYGIARLVMDSIGSASGEQAAKSADSFMVGAMVGSGRNFWKALEATPDADLENAAAAFSRKAFPLVKGFVKGQAEALRDEKDKQELQRLWREFGRDISENVLAPFALGLAEGAASRTAVEGADNAVRGLKDIGAQTGKVIEGLIRGWETIRKGGLPEINIEIPAPMQQPVGPQPPNR